MFAVITENDESQWDDVTGEIYHFPRRYLDVLQPGTKIIYYKGKLTNRDFEGSRLSPHPHYFGKGVIGEIASDPLSVKNDYFCEILDFQGFSEAVSAKSNDVYIEIIPKERRKNHWRYAVRRLDEDIYLKILRLAKTNQSHHTKTPVPRISDELESTTAEGSKKWRYSAYYERKPINRMRAIRHHGYTCMACGFNFEKAYGSHGRNYIHVHHVQPVSEFDRAKLIDPTTDMIVLCPNCHSMIHRDKKRTLSLKELKVILEGNAR